MEAQEFKNIENGNVYPSKQNTIFVNNTSIDEYGNAHNYYIIPCLGFEQGETLYLDNSRIRINFIKKDKDGEVCPGLQNEQLVLILLDRIKKLNKVYPNKNNEMQIQGLEMFLEACRLRIDDRISRNVMGKLEK